MLPIESFSLFASHATPPARIPLVVRLDHIPARRRAATQPRHIYRIVLWQPGWVTSAIAAIRRERYWCTYYKLLQHGSIKTQPLAIALLRLIRRVHGDTVFTLVPRQSTAAPGSAIHFDQFAMRWNIEPLFYNPKRWWGLQGPMAAIAPCARTVDADALLRPRADPDARHAASFRFARAQFRAMVLRPPRHRGTLSRLAAKRIHRTSVPSLLLPEIPAIPLAIYAHTAATARQRAFTHVVSALLTFPRIAFLPWQRLAREP